MLKDFRKKLGSSVLLSYLFQRFIKRNKIITLNLREIHSPIHLRNNASDIQIFLHVFVYDEYNFNLNHEVKIIIDCGANIGIASLYFISKYPDARIIALEPEAENFDLLVENTKRHHQITCLKKGVWNTDGYLEIIDNGWGTAGFMVREVAESTPNAIEAISLCEIIKRYQLPFIDILKLDIEGSEEQVLLCEDRKAIEIVQTIFCEIHENLKPGLDLRIKDVLKCDFNFYKSGEYDVFERKTTVQ